ncbi:MAG: apolipoprotein N-acyltransferase [Nitrospinales bacterium]
MQILKIARPYLLSALSGLLLALVFPRFDLEILAWFALVPLLCAIQDQSPGRASLCGFIAGAVFYFLGLTWILNTIIDFGKVPRPLAYPALAILAAYMSFYIALFAYLVRRVGEDRPIYTFMLAPVAWTGLEYIRSTHLEYGFSWLGLGYSQFKTLPVIQIADYTGVYGVTALIVLVNAGVHYLIRFGLARGGAPYSTRQALSVLAITLPTLAFCLVYGNSALAEYGKTHPPGARGIRVALVQGNIGQPFKWDPRHRDRVMETYKRLTLKGAAGKPDFIVWPEAATPYYFNLDAPETAALKHLARQAGVPIFFGSPYYEQDATGATSYNSAYLLLPSGSVPARYDKMHLVPFGEFVPFRKLLWFVRKMARGIGQFGRGEQATVFRVAGQPFGVSICYEVTFPDLVRQSVNRGARFLVNITNDAWFGRSAASYQHIAMAALRAVENRVPLVRAANTGISGVIDPTGKIRDTTPLFTEDLVLTEIHLTDGPKTYYTRNGDSFSHACILMTLVLAAFARRKQK